MEMKEHNRQLAILIDAENVLAAQADMIFDHAAALGRIARKEIFGAASALGTWVGPVLKYAIHPNLTIKASKGKNSSGLDVVSPPQPASRQASASSSIAVLHRFMTTILSVCRFPKALPFAFCALQSWFPHPLYNISFLFTII